MTFLCCGCLRCASPRGHSGPTSYSASVSAASLDWEGYKYLMSPPARSALKMQCHVRQSLRRLKHRFALSRQRTVIPNTKYEGKQFTLRLGGLGGQTETWKKTQNNNKKLTRSVRPCNFSIAQLFQRDDMSHTATGRRRWKTINASSLPLSLKPAWPPTTQRRLISEAYNCSRHAVNLPVFASFLIETQSLSFFSPTTTPPFTRAAHFLSVGDLSNHVCSYACYERKWKGEMSEHTLL